MKAELEKAGLARIEGHDKDWRTEIDRYWATTIAGVEHYYTESVETHIIIEEGLLFTKANRAPMVAVGDHNGFEVSKDFSEMLKREGYKFIEEKKPVRGTQQIYQNAEKKMEIQIGYYTEDGKDVLSVRYLPIN